MSAVSEIVKKYLFKIFTGVHATMPPNVKIEDVQLAIYFENGQCKYAICKDTDIIQPINLDDYIGGAMDFTGGGTAIDATISQAGPQFAQHLKCGVDDIKVVLNYNHKDNTRCENQKALKKAAGLFRAIPKCECKICETAGFPFGKIYNNNVLADDFYVKLLIP